MSRNNLTVLTKTKVQRIVLNNKRASGLVVRRAGEETTVHARGEVILSGGAINSPQLLMLSGIGDAGNLAEHGIKSVVSSPNVGRNLQDHLGVYLTYACKDPITLYPLVSTRPRAAFAFARAWLTGKGPASAVPLEAGGFLRTRADFGHPRYPYHFCSGSEPGDNPARGRGSMAILSTFTNCAPKAVAA